jgi:hypothetical protein
MSSPSGKTIAVTVPFESISDVSLGEALVLLKKIIIKADHFNAKPFWIRDIVLAIDANGSCGPSLKWFREI